MPSLENARLKECSYLIIDEIANELVATLNRYDELRSEADLAGDIKSRNDCSRFGAQRRRTKRRQLEASPSFRCCLEMWKSERLPV